MTMIKIHSLFAMLVAWLVFPMAMQAQQGVTADFSWAPDPGIVNSPLQFQNQSTGATNTPWFSWYFGDGGTSNAENPSHIYAAPGTYTVLFLVQDSLNGFDSLSKQVNVIASGNTDHFTGQVYIDSDASGTFNTGDIPVGNQMMVIQPGPIYWITDSAGTYDFDLLAGNYTFSLNVPNYFNLTAPAGNAQAISAPGTGQTFTTDFVLDPIGTVGDLRISMANWRFRPGFTSNVWISYQNIGNTVESGTVVFQHPSNLGFSSSTPPPSSVGTGLLNYNFTNLFPQETRTISLQMTLPATVALGTPMPLSASITTPGGDTTANNLVAYTDTVVGSYDPNDKQVSPAFGPEGYVLPGEQLSYTIRFQNTGTDTAFTVRITDTLDMNLTVSSFKMLGASHSYTVSIDENREVVWTFNNILLADSNTNEPASHGYVKYIIDQVPNLADFSLIENTAAIFFDFNEPIITNTTVTTINSSTDLEGELQIQGWKLFPNPAQDAAFIRFDNPDGQLYEVRLLDMQGRLLEMQQTRSNGFRMALERYAPGMYLCQLKAEDGRTTSGKLLLE
jgi:uncharacterized repeat protein (TIGR01451 family)